MAYDFDGIKLPHLVIKREGSLGELRADTDVNGNLSINGLGFFIPKEECVELAKFLSEVYL